MNRNEGQWKVIEHVLTRVSDEKWIPLADELYAAVFESDFSRKISHAEVDGPLQILQFSRFPADVKILVHISDNGNIEARILSIAPEGDEQLLELSHTADHIVINDTWYPILPDALPAIMEILQKSSIEKPGEIGLGQYLSLTKNSNDLVENRINSSDLKLWERYPDESPEGIKANLYSYQSKGWQWLRFLVREKLGGILADEMGLGKTLQIISVISSEGKKNIPSLIICPTTLLENWRREFGKFAPHITAVIHQGPQRTGFPKELMKYDVVITSYDTIIRDLSLFSGISWNIIVCDEAQAIKNPDTRRALSIKKVPRNIAFAVTGTPVENRLTDLWSILDFSVPGYLGTRQEFEARYENSVSGAARLEQLISPLILRRLVTEVATDLPAKIIIPQILDMSDQEADRYEQIRIETLQEFQGNASLVILVRLRLFCTHPFLLDGNSGDPTLYSNKYCRLVEIVDEIVQNGAKVLVFTSFSEMIDIIREDMASRFGIYTNFIDGRTPAEERQKIVDEFSEVQGAALLALNPIAAGAGLNITAANHVIHYNLEWNPAKEDQASARAYRRGQDRPVTIHRLFYGDTVEEAIDDRLTRKRELSGAAVVGVQGEESDFNDIVSAIQKSPRKTD